MNQREIQLVEAIIDTNDKRRHNAAIKLLFYGYDIAKSDERSFYRKNEYVVSLENVVRKCFSGKLYRDVFSDVYGVFVSLFTEYLCRINPEKLLEIQDLKNWLFMSGCNFCNGNRKKINYLLGLDPDSSFSSFDDGKQTEEASKDDSSCDEENPNETSEALDEINEKELEEIPDSNNDTSRWAESLLEYYINRVENEYYRDLIRAIKIELVPVETMAEDYGKTVDDIYRDYNRAWDRLLQICLPDIRIRGKSLFKKYELKLEKRDADLLNKFFFVDNDINSLAVSEGMKKSDMEKAVTKAYKVLLKVAKHEVELDEKEERKEKRELKYQEKEKRE